MSYCEQYEETILSGKTILKRVVSIQGMSIWIQQHVLLMFAIGIIICNFAWLLSCKKKLSISWYAALIIAILHDIVGYTAMRLLAIIEVGGDISKAANMRLFGAVFLLPLFYYFGAKLFKRNTAVVMDISAVCLTIGLIFGRFDCLVGGCCTGMRLPFGGPKGDRTDLLRYFPIVLLPPNPSRKNARRGISCFYAHIRSAPLCTGVVPGGIYDKHRRIAPCTYLGACVVYDRTQYLRDTDGKKKKTGRKE